jgi:hypothetical protein
VNIGSIAPILLLFSLYMHQIIPLFTIVCDHDQRAKEEAWIGPQGPLAFLLSLCLSTNLARIHDEATKSHFGSDTGVQHHLAAGADYGYNACEKDDDG